MNLFSRSKTPSLTDCDFSGGIARKLSEDRELIIYASLDPESEHTQALSLIIVKDGSEILEEFHFTLGARGSDEKFDNALLGLIEFCESKGDLRYGSSSSSRKQLAFELETLKFAFKDGVVERSGTRKAKLLDCHLGVATAAFWANTSLELFRLATRMAGISNPLVDNTGDLMNGGLNAVLVGLPLLYGLKRSFGWIPETAAALSIGSVLMAELSSNLKIGTADPKDIPAGVVGALIGCVYLRAIERCVASREHVQLLGLLR